MFLLILVLFFGSLTQMIGLMLTSGSGSVSLQDVVSEDGLQAHTVGARNILRILQVLFVSGVFILAPWVFAYVTYGRIEETVGLSRKVSPILLLISALCVLGAGYSVDALVHFNEWLLQSVLSGELWADLMDEHRSMNQQMAYLLMSENAAEWLFAFLLIACLPALAEEFMFRGVLQKELIRGLGAPGGIVLTSLFFALTHFQPLHFTGLFFFGLVLGLMRHWSGNLWYSIGAHFVNNATVFISIKMQEAPIEQLLTEREAVQWGYTIAAFLVAGLGLWGFKQILQRRGVQPDNRYY